MTQFCPWEPASYIIYSSNVPHILYYALLPGVIVSLLLSFFLAKYANKNISTQSLVSMFLCFFIWGFFDLIQFSTNSPNITLFFWSLIILVEPLIYFFAILFSYQFLYNKELDFNKTLLLTLPLVPVVLLLPTKFNLIGVNLGDCVAVENILTPYTYSVEILYVLITSFIIIVAYRKAKAIEKQKVLYIGISIVSFLLAFASGNIIGSFTDDWIASQYGYFGMPVFLGFLVYLIVKHHAFNIKLMATQALVWALAIMIGSQYFFIKTPINFVLNTVTFVTIIIFGRFLVKSVEKEVEQREQLGELAGRLELANEQLKAVDERKSDFINIASHQLRTPTTAIKGYTALLLEGDYGEMSEKIKEITARMNNLADQNVKIIADMLNISRIEQNRMKYTFEKVEIAQFILDIIHTLELKAQGKKLPFEYVFDKTLNDSLTTDLPAQAGKKVYANVDRTLLAQVFENVVDNAVKYTLKGYVKIDVRLDGKKLIFKCKDTGIGIDKESLASLFKKFGRAKNAQESGIEGTGIGLYIAKEIMQKHNGDITITSEGEGKGSESTITMEVDSAESHVATVN